MARPLSPIHLSVGQQRTLERFVNSGKTAHWLYQRSQVILMAAAGESNQSISIVLKLSKNTVGQWRQRWLNAEDRTSLSWPL